MNITITTTETKEVHYLQARCGVRYWEDGTVDDVVDEDGSRIPCREGDDWCPLINLNTGVIENWRPGATAELHYKVCDDGAYYLMDADKAVLLEREGYVPAMLACGDPEGGFGDYVILQIDGDGQIANWKDDMRYFDGVTLSPKSEWQTRYEQLRARWNALVSQIVPVWAAEQHDEELIHRAKRSRDSWIGMMSNIYSRLARALGSEALKLFPPTHVRESSADRRVHFTAEIGVYVGDVRQLSSIKDDSAT